jgi:hypothetical protein
MRKSLQVRLGNTSKFCFDATGPLDTNGIYIFLSKLNLTHWNHDIKTPFPPPRSPGAHAGPVPQQAVQGITQEAHQNQHSQTNEGDEFHFTSRRSTAMIR